MNGELGNMNLKGKGFFPPQRAKENWARLGPTQRGRSPAYRDMGNSSP